jgi:adenylylsulfate kinase-like enzyme
MIYVLYGQPAAGKTTLGMLLAGHLGTPFIIDGDEFRSFFANKDYGFGGRKRNIRAANAVATYLNKICDSHIIMSLVNPYKQFRNELKEDNEGRVMEVLLTSDRDLRKEHHVEDFEVGNPHYIVNTDGEVENTWGQLKDILKV